MRSEELFNLTGRVALITGASTRGIGSAAAKFLAENGAKVFLIARREDKLAQMAESIRSEEAKQPTLPVTYPVRTPAN